MSLTYADVRKILNILDSTEQCDYVEVSVGDYVVQAGNAAAAPQAAPMAPAAAPAATPPGQAPASEPAPAAAPAAQAVEDVPADMVAVRAPMAGAFYLTPGPEDPPFVEEGCEVAADDTVCLVEVMKLFNTIKAPISGKVHKIYVEHGAPVQLDQVLLIIEPAGDA